MKTYGKENFLELFKLGLWTKKTKTYFDNLFYKKGNVEISEDLLEEIADFVDLDYIAKRQKLSADFVKKFKDKIHYQTILKYQTDIPFVAVINIYQYHDEKDITRYAIQKTGRELMTEEEAWERINDPKYFLIASYNATKYGDEYIEKFHDKLDWDIISSSRSISTNFVEKWGKYIVWEKVRCENAITKTTFEKYKYRIRWKYFLNKNVFSSKEDIDIAVGYTRMSGAEWYKLLVYQSLLYGVYPVEELLKRYGRKIMNSIKNNYYCIPDISSIIRLFMKKDRTENPELISRFREFIEILLDEFYGDGINSYKNIIAENKDLIQFLDIIGLKISYKLKFLSKCKENLLDDYVRYMLKRGEEVFPFFDCLPFYSSLGEDLINEIFDSKNKPNMVDLTNMLKEANLPSEDLYAIVNNLTVRYHDELTEEFVHAFHSYIDEELLILYCGKYLEDSEINALLQNVDWCQVLKRAENPVKALETFYPYIKQDDYVYLNRHMIISGNDMIKVLYEHPDINWHIRFFKNEGVAMSIRTPFILRKYSQLLFGLIDDDSEKKILVSYIDDMERDTFNIGAISYEKLLRYVIDFLEKFKASGKEFAFKKSLDILL